MKNVRKKVIRKLEYFFPKKRKDSNPFCTAVPIKSHALCTLRVGAARNREIIKPVRILALVSN